MSNNQSGQEALATGWEMIPHPSFNRDSTQEAASEGTEGQSIPAIEAEPVSFFNPKTVNSSSKKRKRGTGSEPLEILEKDFTLFELFNSNDIEELNQGRERTLDPQEVLTNLKGWKIEKRRRIENNGNCRVDKIYHHPRSKNVLRSLQEVMKFIGDNSYLRRASDDGQGSSQDPKVNFSSSSAELFQHPYVIISSLGGDLFQDPNANISSSGGEVFQDPNVTFSSPGGELFQGPHFKFSSPGGELFQDPYFNFSSLGSEFIQDRNLNFYSSGGELFQHPNFSVSSSVGGLFQDPNANLSSSCGEMFQHSHVDMFSTGGDMLQDQLPCMNPESRFHFYAYANMIEGYRQQPQVLVSSRGYNPGTCRSRLAGMASSSSAHLQPQSQEPSYTQRQVDDMLEAQKRAMAEQVRALEERNRAIEAQVDSIQTILRSSGLTIPQYLCSGNANEERKL